MNIKEWGVGGERERESEQVINNDDEGVSDVSCIGLSYGHAGVCAAIILAPEYEYAGVVVAVRVNDGDVRRRIGTDDDGVNSNNNNNESNVWWIFEWKGIIGTIHFSNQTGSINETC